MSRKKHAREDEAAPEEVSPEEESPRDPEPERPYATEAEGQEAVEREYIAPGEPAATEPEYRVDPAAPSDSRAARLDAALNELPRAQKIGLLSERTNLTVPEAAALSTEELDEHVRSVLDQDLTIREASEAFEAERAKNPGSIGDPYGNDKPAHYKVTTTYKPILLDGHVVTFKAGQVLSDRSYDVAQLQALGVPLEPCEPPPPYSPL